MKRFRHLLPLVNLSGWTLHVTEFAKRLYFSALTNGKIVGQRRDTGHTAPLQEPGLILIHSHITSTSHYREEYRCEYSIKLSRAASNSNISTGTVHKIAKLGQRLNGYSF
ncbi:hypothetical protein Y032_0012g1621 [Ancylostoma ceylanicum]|uniref:Uncharacterized protein n=1 Tax=Ancylostoma ceylanicum TaxID=53326 RepID=A0A016VC43_9BILA|nr:hypothetical protein Y032_0012g1621 [Ancylostoma ceylanicum]